MIKDEQAGQQLITRSGLTDSERDELAALREEAHPAFADELVTAVETLRKLLGSGDPLYTLAWVQATNLMSPWGGYYEPTEQGGENLVELVASLLASQPASKNEEWLTGPQVQEVHEELVHIMDVLYLFNFSLPRGGDPEAAALRFMGAMRWMSVRGSSFANHGKDLARAVFSPFDQWLEETYGFTINDVLAVGESVESLMHQSVNALLGLARDYAADVEHTLANPAVRRRLPPEVRTSTASVDQREAASKFAFIDGFSSGIREATTFTLDQLSAHAPRLARGRIAAVLAELAVDVGSIDPLEYTGLFDPSPLVERPFLRYGDRHILPVPGMLLRDTFRVLDARLMRQRPGYSKARAKILDGLAVDLIASMLPGAAAYTNLHYPGGELDGLVLFEETAFAVEGKGSSISFQAQRGDVRRLVKEIRESVERALEQGLRAREFILGPGESVFVDDRGRELLRLPPGVVKDVQIVNPTIHELAGFAPQLARFRSRGLFADGELPWSVYINDLRVIAETCENAAVFLHYLTWRARLALGETVVVQDELDLWGAYLFGARFQPLDEGGAHHVGNSTTDFDAYYAGLQGHGPKREKPRKFLKEPVRAFVERMAVERPTGWRQASGVCLDLSVPELGFVCLRALEAARAATAHGALVEFDFERGLLIGVPRGANMNVVLEHARRRRADASFFIYVREGGTKRARLMWAAYGEKISFELSELEKLVFNAPATSAFDS